MDVIYYCRLLTGLVSIRISTELFQQAAVALTVSPIPTARMPSSPRYVADRGDITWSA